ncbi:MAG: hypothetical protein CMH28_09940 [Micavibrio sp.]|nr:hypothetical protein [Micavibrio sp.]|tara:strand:- start:835 stop:1341 length:507 start_codon:yes stop_codon:yes gene_type:complete
MIELFQSTSVWVLLSFAVFVVVAYRLGKKSVLDALDSKIDKIKNDIETAESLRVEAQELLAQYQRKQREAESEAKRILKTAETHAAQIAKHAEKDLEETLERREAWLKQRLKRMEEDAVREVKAQAVDMAIKATQDILASRIDEKAHAALVSETVSSIPEKLDESKVN